MSLNQSELELIALIIRNKAADMELAAHSLPVTEKIDAKMGVVAMHKLAHRVDLQIKELCE